MSADISRNSFRPAQNYRAVVRQQGRLPIDADDTESEDIVEQMLRDLVEEAICTRGSPDDGFTVSDAVLDNGLLDFQLAGGSFYLGGVRLATEGSAWSAQPDWLTMTDADRGFALPAAGTSGATSSGCSAGNRRLPRPKTASCSSPRSAAPTRRPAAARCGGPCC